MSEAIHEIEHLPEGLVWEVIGQRRYARAYHEVMNAKKQSEVQPGPWTDLVMDVQAEIFKRERGW